jgi:hypothetical protein
VRHQSGQEERKDEHQTAEPGSAFLQHIGRVSTCERVHHAGTESRAKAFLPRALHQDDKDEEQTDNRRQHHEEANKNRHKGEEYGTVRPLGKGNRFRGAAPGPSLRLR